MFEVLMRPTQKIMVELNKSKVRPRFIFKAFGLSLEI